MRFINQKISLSIPKSLLNIMDEKSGLFANRSELDNVRSGRSPVQEYSAIKKLDSKKTGNLVVTLCCQ
jgi:Arc/MetJ-type ribon-helix-helix transcriptional regulator